jgi:putative membrane protein
MMSATMIPQTEETLRLHQANERTMLAWMRTGIAVMAFGFAIARFGLFLRQLAAMNEATLHLSRGIGSTWIGVALVALGMLANLSATVRYGRVRRAIERGEVGAPSAVLVYAFGTAATIVGIVMTVLLAQSLSD